MTPARQPQIKPTPKTCELVSTLYNYAVEQFTSAEDDSEVETAFMKMLDLFPQTHFARTQEWKDPCATHTSAQPSDNKGELVYGSVTKSGEDWRMRSFDAGMGETDYRIFRDGVFFAQFDNRNNADTIMELMTGAQPSKAQQRIEFTYDELIHMKIAIKNHARANKCDTCNSALKKIALLQVGEP